MNEELNKKLIETLEASSEVYGGAKQATLQAVDLIKEQAPELVEQLLLFKLLSSSFNALLCLAYLVCFCTIMVKTFWSKAMDEGSRENVLIIGGILGGIGAAFSSVGFISESTEVIQILVAPKIFLLEYLAQLTGVK